jgi:hypothetical protein
MDEFFSPEVRTFLAVFIGISIIGLGLAMLLVVWILWRVKRIELPPDADFLNTLRHTPLSVVILLDVLDLTFDFLAAPFAWVLLSYLNLHALRAVTVIEAMIPGTQFLPTMTAAWLFARYISPGSPSPFDQNHYRRR